MPRISHLLPAVLPILALATMQAAMAQTHHNAPAPTKPSHAAARSPKAIGKFEDWEAAIHQEGSQTVCYAFTRAVTAGHADTPAARTDAVLTVTERPSGRDAVAITTGFTFAANAAVTVAIDQTNLDFYTAQRAAFARDGHAAITAFLKGHQAVAHEPGPHGTTVTDSFSLRGFDQAYAAINKACPSK